MHCVCHFFLGVVCQQDFPADDWYLSSSRVVATRTIEVIYMRRKSMSPSHSRANFRSGAGIHKKNIDARPMRGGWRL